MKTCEYGAKKRIKLSTWESGLDFDNVSINSNDQTLEVIIRFDMLVSTTTSGNVITRQYRLHLTETVTKLAHQR